MWKKNYNDSSWWGGNRGDKLGQREKRKIKVLPLQYLWYRSLMFPLTVSASSLFSSMFPSHCLPTRSLCFSPLTINGANKQAEHPAQQLAVPLPSRAFSVMLSIPERWEQSNDQITISTIHLRLHALEEQEAEVRALTVEEHFLLHCHCIPAGEKPLSLLFLVPTDSICDPELSQHRKCNCNAKVLLPHSLWHFNLWTSSAQGWLH